MNLALPWQFEPHTTVMRLADPRDYETRSVHTNQDAYERLSPDDLKQAAVVEAIFLYNAAMRDQMLPRAPFPHPELEKKTESNLRPDAAKH